MVTKVLHHLQSAVRAGYSYLRLCLWFALTKPGNRAQSTYVRWPRFNLPFMLKRSHFLTSTEYDALTFLRSTGLNLPIPRVVDHIVYGGHDYTVMTRLPGWPLLGLMGQKLLTPEEVESVLQEVHEKVVQRLWTLRLDAYPEFPQGMVSCSASGHGLPNYLAEGVLHGPMSIDDQWATQTRHLEEAEALLPNEWNGAAFHRALPDASSCLSNDDVVWAHCDLRGMNILVDANKRLSGVIDWENSGWQARHWQVLILRMSNGLQVRTMARAWQKIRFPDETEKAYTVGLSMLIDQI